MSAGGTTSWHGSPGEALRIARVYLLKWHGEGQLPYATLVRRTPHADSVVRRCEQWLGEHYRETGAIKQVIEFANIPERTLKRRFILSQIVQAAYGSYTQPISSYVSTGVQGCG